MNLPLTICLLAACAALGASLSCERCVGFGHTCKGPVFDCLSHEDVCGIIQAKSSGVFEMEIAVKTCLQSRYCNESRSFDFGRTAQMLVQTTCCLEKQCEKPLPPINATPNGKKCPACYAVNNLECKGVVAECTGNNVYCAEIRDTRQLENWSVSAVLKGCTSHDICKDMHDVYLSAVLDIDHCVTSSGPSTAIPGSSLFFLQTFSGLLLLKIVV